MKRILFQGDSITDAGRNRADCFGLGGGYPAYVAGRLGLEYPDRYEFYNRGISGNRVVDLYARIKEDIINLKPDYMSILIGVNDVWHELSRQNGVEAEKYKKIYSMLIEEVKEKLPELKIIMIEPFVLKGASTSDQIAVFREETEKRAAIAKQLAEQYRLAFVPLQQDLDRLSKEAPEGYWLIDGVHPTVYFHQYIADRWIETFQRLEK